MNDGKNQELVNYTVELPKDLVERLHQFSTYLNDSQNWIAKKAFTAWLDEHEEERKMLYEARGQVKRGEVKSQEEVERHVQHLLDDLENPSYESILTKRKEPQQIGIINKI